MRERNNGNPQLGQRRLAIGGNGDGSKRYGCGMDTPLIYRRERNWSLSHRRLRAGRAVVGDKWHQMLANDASQSANIVKAVNVVSTNQCANVVQTINGVD